MPLVKRASPVVGNAALVLVIGSVGLATLAFGAVHAPWMAAAAGLAHVGLGVHALDRWLRRRPVLTSWLCLPVVVGLVLTLFELTPLPVFLRELLNPGGTERVLFVTAALPDEVRGLVRAVLSVDPPETAFAALRLSTALCVFVVVADRCRAREGRRLAFLVLLAFGAALALISVGHWLLSLNDIYGVLRGYGGVFASPLINPNHAARAFGAFSLLLVGRAFLARARPTAAAFAVVGGLLGLCTLLIPSRGGTLAYVAAFGALLWLTARARRAEQMDPKAPPRRRLPPRALLVVQLVGLGLAGALLMAGKEVLEQLFPAEAGDPHAQGKFVLYRPALEAVKEYWRAGAGNNAFQSALPPTLQPGDLWEPASISHPENLLLQVLVDHGVVLGGLLLLSALGVVAALLARSSRPAVVPGLATLGFLVVGDLVDFSLEQGFGVLLAAFALGTCAAALLSADETAVRVRRTFAMPAVVVLALIALGTASMAVADQRIQTDRKLAEASGDTRRALLLRAVARHPSDSHYAYGLAAVARERRDLKGALSWANRALILWPAHPGAHVEAARALAALGYLDQALLEYRLAWQSGEPKAALLKEVAARTKDVALRRRAVPAEPSAVAAVCRGLVGEQRNDDADACYGDAAQMAGAEDAVWIEWVKAALRREDAAAAQERIKLRLGDKPADGELASLYAQADAFLRGAEQALEASDTVARAAKNPVPLQKWRFHIALSLEDREEARDILEHLRRYLREPRDRDWLDRQEATLLTALGENAEALDRWRRVSRRKPKDLRAALAQGHLELKLGLVAEAERTLSRARALSKDNRQVQKLADEVARADQAKRENRLRGIMERSRDAEGD